MSGLGLGFFRFRNFSEVTGIQVYGNGTSQGCRVAGFKGFRVQGLLVSLFRTKGLL